MSLHTTQTDALLRPIVPERVSKDGKGFSHVQAYDVRRRLIEIFGFGGWSGEVTDMTPIFEQEVTLLKKDYKTKQPIPGTEYQAWNVAYRCTYRLTIHATSAVYTETATGDSSNHPSRADAHDMAVKTAESQAFKRAAVNLGSQAGLSLYDSQNPYGPIVRYVLGEDPARFNEADGTITRPQVAAHADTTDHVNAPVTPEDSPAGPAETETPTLPTTPATPARQGTDAPKSSQVADLRERALKATKKAELLRLLMEVGKSDLGEEMTSDESGRGMSLEALINTRIREVAA